MAKSVKNGEKAAKQETACSTLPEFGAMIRTLRHSRSMTLDQLAAATGVSKPYLSNIETARLLGPPSPEILARLESGLGVDEGTLIRLADWLRTPDSIRRLMPQSANLANVLPRHASGAVNVGAPLKSGQSAGSLAPGKNPRAKNVGQTSSLSGSVVLRQVPLINRVSAGVADSYIAAPAPDSPGQTEQDLFALRIEGNSMEPDYRAGEIIVLSVTQTLVSGQDCLVRLDEAENFSTTFKRIYFVDSAGKADETADLVQLVPLNPEHKMRTVQRSRISGLFPAVWKITPAGRSEGKPSAIVAQAKTRKTRRHKPRQEMPGLSSVREKSQASALRPARSSSTFSIEND